MSGLISVLMPVLNEEASVEDAVRSVLDQQGVEVEVLVVDGDSSDGTARIVTALAAADPRVRLLRNPAVVIPAGLNVGLAHARGDFVARVDGHASLSEGYYALALQRLQEDPSLGGIGGIRAGVGRTPAGRAVALALGSRFGVGDSIIHYGTSYQLTDHATFGVYRAEAAREVGGWDESLLVNEDVDFDHRILRTGRRLAFDPGLRVAWQVRESVGALLRQYRRYGRGKAAMARKNGPEVIRARHLAAPAAVLGTAALAALATRHPRWAATAYAPYVLGVAGASVLAWRDRVPGEQTDPLALPLAFAAMHYGWGLGFLEGYLLGRTPDRASGNAAVTARPARVDPVSPVEPVSPPQ